MKKQNEKKLLSLSKNKIASLNYMYRLYGGTNQTGAGFPTGGETTTPAIPVPETFYLACEDDSNRYVLKPKKKKEGTVLGDI